MAKRADILQPQNFGLRQDRKGRPACERSSSPVPAASCSAYAACATRLTSCSQLPAVISALLSLQISLHFITQLYPACTIRRPSILSAKPSPERIDTHFHIVLDCYVKAINAAGGDPSGWQAPAWSVEEALKVMDGWQIKTSVLSITSPGPAIAGTGEEARKLTRRINEETAQIVKGNPGRFKFFASMPSFVDAEGAIAEAEYSLKTLGASGVVVMTSYSDKLLGDPSFQSVWDKLDELKAVVFVHPASVDILPRHIAGKLPQPTVDYPLQTTRTAIDLVMTGTFAKCPNLEIILSHAGGALPFLAKRALLLLGLNQVAEGTVSKEQAEADFQRFYLDVAMSTSKSHLYGLLHFTSPDKLLYGSDWPYASWPLGDATTKQFDDFCANEPEGELLKGVNNANAKKLFGW